MPSPFASPDLHDHPSRGVHTAAVLLLLAGCTPRAGADAKDTGESGPPDTADTDGHTAETDSGDSAETAHTGESADTGDTGDTADTASTEAVAIHTTCPLWVSAGEAVECPVWAVEEGGARSTELTLTGPAGATLVDGVLRWTPAEEHAGPQAFVFTSGAVVQNWTITVAADRVVAEAEVGADGSLELDGEVGSTGFRSFRLSIPAGGSPAGSRVTVSERVGAAQALTGTPVVVVETDGTDLGQATLELDLPVETWTALGYREALAPLAAQPSTNGWDRWENQVWDPETRVLTVELGAGSAVAPPYGARAEAVVAAVWDQALGVYRFGTIVNLAGETIVDADGAATWMASLYNFRAGERNCLLVHGIFADYSTFLHDAETGEGQADVGPWAERNCDNVLLFNYGWGYGVEINGEALHTALAALDSGNVHVFAHSNGGLVSRWVAQVEGDGDLPVSLATLVTLATPHDGAMDEGIEDWFWELGVIELSLVLPAGIDDLLQHTRGSPLYTLALTPNPLDTFCVAGINNHFEDDDGLVSEASATYVCPTDTDRISLSFDADYMPWTVHGYTHERFTTTEYSAAVSSWLGWDEVEPPPAEDCWEADDGDADGLAGCDDDDCWSTEACEVELTSVWPSSATQGDAVSVTISGQHFRTDGSAPRLYAGDGIEITDARWLDEETLTATFAVGCDAPLGIATIEFAQPDETGGDCTSTGRACEDLFEVVEDPACGLDADGDGVPSAEDCDDADATAYPGATERCDLVDNDCDGTADPDCTGPTYHSGTLSADETWYAADGPHILSGSVSVAAGATLTIEAGSVVYASGSYLEVYGALVAIGRSGNEVQFRSPGTSARAGDWQGIHLAAGSSAQLEFARIEHATTGVTVYSEDARITDSRIETSRDYGFYVVGPPPTGGDDPANFARNTVTGGEGSAGAVYLNRAGLIDGSCVLSGNANDEVEVWARETAGTLPGDVTMQALDVPWVSSDDYRYCALVDGGTLTLAEGAEWDTTGSPCLVVGSSDFADLHVSASALLHAGRITVGYGTSAGSLSIDEGAELRFSAGGTIAAAIELASGSTLSVNGSATAPVRLTSAAATPAPGDWQGLYLAEGSSADITQADLSYANVGVWIGSGAVRLSDSYVWSCRTYGVQIGSGVEPTLTGMTYSGNPEDVHYD